MFTGIIQTKATVSSIQRNSSESRFVFKPLKAFENYEIGESIAINGVCLTVESFDTTSFSAYASSKTLELTNLGKLNLYSTVNCERALRLGDRLGGHMVSGHVDATARLLDINDILSSKICTFALPECLKGLIISQGSVCLDGISLTVSELGSDTFSVNVIPETWKETTIAQWKNNDLINIESDIIGKYVHSCTKGHFGEKSSKITESYLRELGY